MTTTSFLVRAGLVVIYLGLNIGLNMMNKWMLGIYGFKFPLLLTVCHQIFSFLALAPVMVTPSFRDTHLQVIQGQWRGLLAVGMFFAVNVSFNNLSLLTISLSLNQVIRASIPLVAAVGAVFIENKKPSGREFLSLAILAGGVGLAVYDGAKVKGSFWGIVLCITGTVSNGLMMTCSGKVMSERIDVLRLTFYTAPVVSVVLVPFYLAMEHAKFVAYDSHGYLLPLALSCVLALSYNMVHYLMIQLTSSVTTTVLGEMKIVLILVLSAVFLGESKIWSLNMVLGCVAAILGFVMYSHHKLGKLTVTETKGSKGESGVVETLKPLLESSKSSTA